MAKATLRQQRDARDWPWRTRWWIVRVRERTTWRQLWADLWFLVRG